MGTGFTPNQGVKLGYHLDNPSGGVREGHPDTFTSDQTGGFIHLIPLKSDISGAQVEATDLASDMKATASI